MASEKKNRWLAGIAGALALALLAAGIYEVRSLRTAHSTFENYYAFRGCMQLISRTDTTGQCKLSDGQIITLVPFRGRWYLDGDLPACAFGVCL